LDKERNQLQNKENALSILEARILEKREVEEFAKIKKLAIMYRQSKFYSVWSFLRAVVKMRDENGNTYLSYGQIPHYTNEIVDLLNFANFRRDMDSSNYHGKIMLVDGYVSPER